MLSLFSPAKINLFLQVGSKREDGYHELSSLMQTVSLGDFISYQVAQKDSFSCSDTLLPIDDNNLVLKALKVFRKKSHCNLSFKIHLEKKVPFQAGLGGGSSNAATTLWALNQLTEASYSDLQLMQMGAEIGCDVPFFLSMGTAHCTGRGEKVTLLPNLAKNSLTIVTPSFGQATELVYAQLTSFRKNFKKINTISLQEKLVYENDLEKAAFAANPKLANVKNKLLQSGFEIVLLSGSGSSFFCFGTADLSSHSDLSQYHVHFIHRSTGKWYHENLAGSPKN